jgi:hypothetical protein
MKKLYVIPAILLFTLGSCSQFRMGQGDELTELSSKVDSLITKVDKLTEQNKLQDSEISWLELQIADFDKDKDKEKPTKPASPATVSKPVSKPVVKTDPAPVEDLQCQAITNSGKRCSRPALKGSKYCLQHKQIYEPDIPGNTETPKKNNSKN